MVKMPPWLPWALWIVVLAVFLWTRLFNLQERFFFWNDMGRDYMVLWDWKNSGKPPLLGPQNSVLPFNQSALYFYWLMPMWLITGASYFSSVYTLLLTYIAVFVWAIWLLRRDKEWKQWRWLLLGFAWLLTIHPSVIEQNIFVWNPSFVPPFLLVTIISWWQWHISHKKSWLIWLGLSAGVSLAFTYSLIPLFVALALVIIAMEKQRSWQPILAMAVGTLVTQLPTLAFELRHNFLLSKAVGNWLSAGMPDAGNAAAAPTVAAKLHNLLLFGLGVSNNIQHAIVICLFVGGISWWGYQLFQKKSKKWQAHDYWLLFLVSVFTLTLLLTLLLPTPVHAHYIFGFVTFFFLISVSLPRWSKFALLGILSLIWLSPTQLLRTFHSAPRTVADSVACAKQVCSQETHPVFVSVQSDLHPYHSGPEWRYFFASNGCVVRSIELEPQAANTMLMVNEFSEYTHGQTAFNELTLFGESTDTKTISCSNGLSVHVLER